MREERYELSLIADFLNWKYLGSQERRLVSGKAVVSVVYGRGIFGVKEIEAGSKGVVGFPLTIREN